MTNPFDADDLLKRSIFSSILGFSRKIKNSAKVESVKGENANGSATSINNDTAALGDLTPCNPKYRTKQEIYNEIVCECAELEKNKVASAPSSARMRSVACSTNELIDTAINPCNPHSPLSTENNNNKTIQNLVQLLVAAVRESGILNDQSGTNSSEDILKRKDYSSDLATRDLFLKYLLHNCTVQNKKAAIRYRKRQKELKEEAELELTILVNKNNELKNEIKRMQAEIDQLKARVLKRTSEESQSFRET